METTLHRSPQPLPRLPAARHQDASSCRRQGRDRNGHHVAGTVDPHDRDFCRLVPADRCIRHAPSLPEHPAALPDVQGLRPEAVPGSQHVQDSADRVRGAPLACSLDRGKHRAVRGQQHGQANDEAASVTKRAKKAR